MKYLKIINFLTVSALLLAGCQMALPAAEAEIAYAIELASDGLNVPGTAQQISFGRAEAGTVAAVTKLLGGPPESTQTNQECGAGPVTTTSWPAGLSLMFLNGNFRGWSSETQDFATGNGYAAGMTMTQLRAAGVTDFETTTLGTEFDLGGIYGLLQKTGTEARVDVLWAGVSCFFR